MSARLIIEIAAVVWVVHSLWECITFARSFTVGFYRSYRLIWDNRELARALLAFDDEARNRAAVQTADNVVVLAKRRRRTKGAF